MSAFKDWLNLRDSKSTPVDADVTYLRDSEASGASKKLTLSNLWLYIKGKADTVYSTFSGSYNDLDDKPTLGSAAALDTGTSAGNVVVLDGSARLPAVDGSQLTNLPSGGAAPGGSAGQVQYGDGSAFQGSPLWRADANTLEQRNGTTAQTFRVYNTYTDASNYERGFVHWNANVFEIGTEKAGTGSSRRVAIKSATDFVLSVSGRETLVDGNGDWFFSRVLHPGGTTVGNETALSTTTLSFGKDHAAVSVTRKTRANDLFSAGSLSVIAGAAYPSAVTNIVGDALILRGGDGASGSSGAAHGGNVEITPGTGYGTGRAGYVIVSNLPTSASGLPTGALWNDGGTLKIA